MLFLGCILRNIRKIIWRYIRYTYEYQFRDSERAHFKVALTQCCLDIRSPLMLTMFSNASRIAKLAVFKRGSLKFLLKFDKQLLYLHKLVSCFLRLVQAEKCSVSTDVNDPSGLLISKFSNSKNFKSSGQKNSELVSI